MNKTIISHAYELAKDKYGKKAFTFENLWKELVKKLKLDKDEQKQVGQVYSSMLQDNRFIFAGDNQWKLREFLTVEQQKDLSNALYGFKSDEEEAEKTKQRQDEDEPYFSYKDEEDELMAQANADSLEDEDFEDEEQEEESEEIEDEEEDA